MALHLISLWDSRLAKDPLRRRSADWGGIFHSGAKRDGGTNRQAVLSQARGPQWGPALWGTPSVPARGCPSPRQTHRGSPASPGACPGRGQSGSRLPGKGDQGFMVLRSLGLATQLPKASPEAEKRRKGKHIFTFFNSPPHKRSQAEATLFAYNRTIFYFSEVCCFFPFSPLFFKSVLCLAPGVGDLVLNQETTNFIYGFTPGLGDSQPDLTAERRAGEKQPGRLPISSGSWGGGVLS